MPRSKSAKSERPPASINLYEVLAKTHPELLPPKRTYKGEEETMLSIPCRIAVCAPTGAYKSNCVVQTIMRMDDAWDYYILCVKKVDEPLMKALILSIEQKAKKRGVSIEEMLFVCTELEQVPPIDGFQQDDKRNTLLFLDDQLCSLKKGKIDPNIEQYLIRGRSKNVSVIVIVQDWTTVDPFLRSQMTHAFFLRVRNERSLRYALGSMGDSKELFPLYKRAVMGAPTNWFCVDFTTADPKWQFRTCLEPNEEKGALGPKGAGGAVDEEDASESDSDGSVSDREDSGGRSWDHRERGRDGKGRWLPRQKHNS